MTLPWLVLGMTNPAYTSVSQKKTNRLLDFNLIPTASNDSYWYITSRLSFYFERTALLIKKSTQGVTETTTDVNPELPASSQDCDS